MSRQGRWMLGLLVQLIGCVLAVWFMFAAFSALGH
jgi:hypothetical protein